MTWTEHTCVSVTCDTCREYYNGEFRLHFDSRDEAVADLVEAEWNVDGDKVECSTCKDKRICREKGHEFDAWRLCRCGCADGTPRIPKHTMPMEARWCERDYHHEERLAGSASTAEEEQ